MSQSSALNRSQYVMACMRLWVGSIISLPLLKSVGTSNRAGDSGASENSTTSRVEELGFAVLPEGASSPSHVVVSLSANPVRGPVRWDSILSEQCSLPSRAE